MIHMQNRTLYFGDNLDILRQKFPEKSDGDGYFDLIYLDPPFNSNRDYNVLFKEGVTDSQAQVRAFEDSWHWTEDAQSIFEELVGVRKSKTKINEQISNLMVALEKLVGHNDVLAYLTMMTIRLIELHRVLKKTGSIYLHCDPTASHYLKVVMDAIFGKKNFKNEIVWHYKRWTAVSKRFQRMHDIIFFYTKSDSWKFNPQHQPFSEKTAIAKYARKVEGGRAVQDKTKLLERDPEKGVAMDDVWDISYIHPIAKERLGYPTQKPEALLERIITTSSHEGDWVLDPFSGCGTTVSVAEKLERKWVGIDITALAINLIKHRLRKQFPEKPMQITIDGLPKDLAGAKALFKKDPFEFEYWVLDLVNAMPAQSKTKENMRGADKGIDGVITFVRDIKNGKFDYGKILVQVKGGAVQRNDIATLRGDVDREKAVGGLFITLEESTRPMREEAISSGKYKVSFGVEEFPKIQIMTIKELLVGSLPKTPLWSQPYYKEAKKVSYNPTQTQTRIEFL